MLTNPEQTARHIIDWLDQYLTESGSCGFIVGISGGIDSAVTSTLCAKTGKKTIVTTMPIKQGSAELERADEHIEQLCNTYSNVASTSVDLNSVFDVFCQALGPEHQDPLALANARARLRMTTLYAIAASEKLLVAGTGNKVEDFGVGFFTKYGDGGVDLSPIADINKTEVYQVAKALDVVQSIQDAAPTDGLWEDGRTDEDQLQATYPEIEWAMDFYQSADATDITNLSDKQRTTLATYSRLHRANAHKFNPIPVCTVPRQHKA